MSHSHMRRDYKLNLKLNSPEKLFIFIQKKLHELFYLNLIDTVSRRRSAKSLLNRSELDYSGLHFFNHVTQLL